MTLKLPTSIAFILIFTLVLTTAAPFAVAQTKRQTQPKRAQLPTPPPAPTFETLLAADSYKLYLEVRSVGQLIRSNSVTEILEPIMQLASPPRGFRNVVKWLNTHADEVMTSRALLASWPKKGDLPNELVAIEFASAEEAAKFQQRLHEFLPMVVPTPTSESSPQSDEAKSNDSSAKKPAQTGPPKPPYHLQQAGSLILITSAPFKLEKLRPAGSKLLAEDVNFRVARNRFSSESIFFFLDVAEIEKEEEEQRKKFEEQRQTIAEMEKSREEVEKAQAELEAKLKERAIDQPADPEKPNDLYDTELKVVGIAGAQDASQLGRTEQFTLALTLLTFFTSSFSAEEPKWPEAIGVALSLEGDSFDLRALLVTAPGKTSDPLPFLPLLKTGPALTSEAPNILPADTEMLVSLSLDVPNFYAAISKPRPIATMSGIQLTAEQNNPLEPPFEQLEKKLKISIKDDLLPLIGSEVVLSLPLHGLDLLQPPAAAQPSPSPSASPSPVPDKEATDQAKTTASPVLLVSLKDKEGMRTLLPKIIETAAFKGANSFAQTERREDTELVSYANLLAYAFIGNFLVISADSAATRHVVDSYLNHQTLSGDPQFKNATRWQPRVAQAQFYVSPALMESYRTWVQTPSNTIDEPLRTMLTRLTIVPQPITYSLSNEGFGPLHELHLPKNLVLMFIASIAGAAKAVTVQEPPTSNPN